MRCFALLLGREPRRDDADGRLALGKYHNQMAPECIKAKRDEALFALCVRVWLSEGQVILKHRYSISEFNAVLGDVGTIFGFIYEG